jgi:hypothetical protein
MTKGENAEHGVENDVKGGSMLNVGHDVMELA